MKAHTDPLIDDYLRRLGAAASRLPADQREELSIPVMAVGVIRIEIDGPAELTFSARQVALVIKIHEG